jgi:lipopolysaccharide transport system ATP-binding protein
MGKKYDPISDIDSSNSAKRYFLNKRGISMRPVVCCDDVSKKYNLGVSRTSLLTSFSNSLNSLIRPGVKKSSQREVLWALKGIDFKLYPGESLGLIGQNGAGKSTLLKLLANITHPTSGKIVIEGRLSALIELGSGFHFDLTGRENIFLNGTILGLSRKQIQNRFDEIVAFSEIERFIDTPVKRYSSGMLVRLGFAVASCIEPEILLVDEVLAVGDASFRQKCLKRIKSLLDEGTSMIFVSHDLNMVQGVCANVIYIKEGQIKFSGKTKDAISIYERDLHEEQAQKFSKVIKKEMLNELTDVKIKQVEIFNSKGEKSSEFSSEQPVEIQVSYFASREIANANAVVRIVRSDGLTVCRLRSSIDGVSMILPQGDGKISAFIEPLQLTGGNYFVVWTIKTENDLVLLDGSQSEWFYVSGSPLSHVEENGFFLPNHRWTLQN